ncbi:MAG: hypothetical protein WCO26_15040 [Deltaproteobacteria bacterium]
MLRVLQKGSLKDGKITIGFHDCGPKVVYDQTSSDPSEKDPRLFHPVDQGKKRPFLATYLITDLLGSLVRPRAASNLSRDV